MLEVSVEKTLIDGTRQEFHLNVTFKIGNGFTVLTGPSGSGKTSTLQLIAGILRPDAGRIALDKRTFFDSAGSIDLPIQDRKVGFVFQDYALFPHLTALENVAYGIRKGDRRAKALELLETFRIEHTRSRRPHEMSGGEQQRAALARALASNPSIVLLDEPLSAVDVETRSKLLAEIEIAQQKADVPFVYVTHSEAEAERFGGSRIHIEKGRANTF
ncbi:MAG: ATP-binding cassette domain-containing protein [Pyrinomonadaceae bacterium]